MALASTSVTLLPLAMLSVLPPKLLAAWLRLMLLALPAVKLIALLAPFAVNAPLWVIAPPAVRFKSPDTVDAPRISALALLTATSLPLTTASVLNRLAEPSVMLLAPAVNVAVLATVLTEIMPDWVILPPLEVTFKSPETVEAPRMMPPVVSLSATLLPLTTATEEKLFACVLRVMSFAAPAVMVAAPVTLTTPDCVILPPAVNANVPLIADAPRSMPLLSCTFTLLAVLMISLEKLLPAWASVMSFPVPAVKVASPVTTSGPVCVTAPAEVEVNAPLMVVTPNASSPELVVNEPVATTVPDTVRLPVVCSAVVLVLVRTTVALPMLVKLFRVTSPLLAPPTIVMLLPLKSSAAD